MTMINVSDDCAPHPKPRDAEMTSATDREAFDFAMRVYKETGVTPELRRVYDFYKKALNKPQPSVSVAEAAKVLVAAWDADELPVSDPDPMLPEFIAALRALSSTGEK